MFIGRPDTETAARPAHSLEMGIEVQRRAMITGDPYWTILGSTAEAGARSILVRQHDLADAVRAAHLARLETISRDANAFGNPYLATSANIYLANAIARQRPDLARELLEAAIAVAEPLDLLLITGQARVALAAVHSRGGHHHEALMILATAIEEHAGAGAAAELVTDLAAATRPLQSIGNTELVDEIVQAIRISGVDDYQLLVTSIATPDFPATSTAPHPDRHPTLGATALTALDFITSLPDEPRT